MFCRSRVIIIMVGVVSLFGFSCTQKFKTEKENLPIISLKQLEKITQGDELLYIINFWATWCKPCVEELPYFEKMNEKYKSKGVQTLLISLDFKEDLETKLQPYIIDNQIESQVYLLDVEKEKGWIDQVNPNWSGAIPATIIQSKHIKNTFFKEGELSLEELEALVEKYYQQALKNKLP